MGKPRLQIVRGLPGSGKSTYATAFWPHLYHLEFDFFCHRAGVYAWGESRNAEGQRWLSTRVVQTCIDGIDFVLCGVFAGHSENLKNIIDTALAYGYEVYVKTLTTNFVNRHGCREEDLSSMRADFKSDDDLKIELGYNTDIRFGAMQCGFTVEPMEDGR